MKDPDMVQHLLKAVTKGLHSLSGAGLGRVCSQVHIHSSWQNSPPPPPLPPFYFIFLFLAFVGLRGSIPLSAIVQCCRVGRSKCHLATWQLASS